jgi:hypothetical protein
MVCGFNCSYIQYSSETFKWCHLCYNGECGGDLLLTLLSISDPIIFRMLQYATVIGVRQHIQNLVNINLAISSSMAFDSYTNKNNSMYISIRVMRR